MSSTLDEYKEEPVEYEGTLKMGKTWVLLNVPKEIQQMLLSKVNQPIAPNQQPHISVIKDEKPCLNLSDWDNKKFEGETVKFQINTRSARDDNGMHVWFDCYSPR